jgi:hypothetical protein
MHRVRLYLSSVQQKSHHFIPVFRDVETNHFSVELLRPSSGNADCGKPILITAAEWPYFDTLGARNNPPWQLAAILSPLENPNF